MKKFLILFLLFPLLLIALESNPSEVVGYVKYECITTAGTNFNLVAYSMEMGFTMASDLGDYIGGVSSISFWDASQQGWASATFISGPNIWTGDFALVDGCGYMVNMSSNSDAFIAGSLLIPPTFYLETTASTDFNLISIPLDRSDLAMASELGNEIGNVTTVSYWDASQQGWASATFIPGPNIWTGDFPIEIGDVLFVVVTGNSTWPATLTSAEETVSIIDSK